MNHMKTNKLNTLSTLIIGTFLSAAASAAPMGLEGPIQAVVDNGDGSGSMTVMGITVEVPAGTSIITPTTSLTMSQLADPTPLPGRDLLDGFIGGTAIINGDTTNGYNVAADIFAEPAENILIGEISHNCVTATCDGAGEQIFISGSEIAKISDVRMLARPAVNGTGLEIDLSTVAQGSPVAAEGYYGPDNLFHYFIIEAEGNLINAAVDTISIARARCRNGKTMRIQGGVSQSSGVVTIINYGTTPIVADAITGLGTYQFRRNNINTCPAEVTVQFNNATATLETSR